MGGHEQRRLLSQNDTGGVGIALDAFTDEDLEEALPSDLYEAAQAYLNDLQGKDRYLAEQEGELGKQFHERHDRIERQQQARAEAVAEDPETPVLDATVYEDEEGV